MNFIDKKLNSITMYRVVLYGLVLLAAIAIALGFFGVIFYSGFDLIFSLVIITASSMASNVFFAKLYRAPRNIESVYITAFILFFLMEPLMTLPGIVTLVAVSVVSMLSKYLFAIGKRHVFNPVAIATVLLTVVGSGAVIWWVSTPVLSLATLVIGFLIVRKIRRFPLVISFIVTAMVSLGFTSIAPSGQAYPPFIKELFLSWPLVFFATIMLTEPLTTPPTKSTQVTYGVLVGLLFASVFSVGPLRSTPELALVLGNIYSYLVSSKQKLLLNLSRMTRLTPTVYDFAFTPDQRLRFRPGQYLEWTLPHEPSDSRGNRRYFTVASSSTEKEVHLGVRIDGIGSSSFKRALLEMGQGDMMVASHLSGEFTLPRDPARKLVFIAGGIGVTPFRSMVKYLLDNNERRDVVLLYFANADTDFAYSDLFEEARAKIGLAVDYIASVPTPAWKGRTGRLTPQTVAEIVPDFKERYFMLSGPNAMVENYKKLLHSMGVASDMIQTDYFPGF